LATPNSTGVRSTHGSAGLAHTGPATPSI